MVLIVTKRACQDSTGIIVGSRESMETFLNRETTTTTSNIRKRGRPKKDTSKPKVFSLCVCVYNYTCITLYMCYRKNVGYTLLKIEYHLTIVVWSRVILMISLRLMICL